MDKREFPRNRVLRAGTIEFDGGAIACMVRNMSDNGAMLDVATAAVIPEHFTLILRADGSRMPCHIVWWKDNSSGFSVAANTRAPFRERSMGLISEAWPSLTLPARSAL